MRTIASKHPTEQEHVSICLFLMALLACIAWNQWSGTSASFTSIRLTFMRNFVGVFKRCLSSFELDAMYSPISVNNALARSAAAQQTLDLKNDHEVSFPKFTFKAVVALSIMALVHTAYARTFLLEPVRLLHLSSSGAARKKRHAGLWLLTFALLCTMPSVGAATVNATAPNSFTYGLSGSQSVRTLADASSHSSKLRQRHFRQLLWRFFTDRFLFWHGRVCPFLREREDCRGDSERGKE